jgi:hypothetical protein
VYTGRHAFSCVFTSRPAQPNSWNSHKLIPIEREALRNELNAGVLFKQDVELHNEINLGLTVKLDTPFTLLTRNYSSVRELQLELERMKFRPSYRQDVNENLYEKIKQRGNKYLELPSQNCKLVRAFSDMSRWVIKQTLLPEKLGTVPLDHVFLFSLQLLTSAILGIDFLLMTLQL